MYRPVPTIADAKALILDCFNNYSEDGEPITWRTISTFSPQEWHENSSVLQPLTQQSAKVLFEALKDLFLEKKAALDIVWIREGALISISRDGSQKEQRRGHWELGISKAKA